MPRPFLSVVIPAYNEGKQLPLTLIDVDRHLSEQDFPYEIIVVSSPSSDNTAEIMRRFQQIIKHLTCISLIENQGRGLAVKTGLQAAKGSWRLVMDADNSVAVVEFGKMRPYLSTKVDATFADKEAGTVHEGYDIVMGSRYVPGANMSSTPSAMQRMVSGLGRWFITTLLTRGIKDPNSGFKCFSADLLTQLLPKVISTGWAFDAELLRRAQKAGYKVKEIPVFYSYEAGTRRTPRSYLKMTVDFIGLLFKS